MRILQVNAKKIPYLVTEFVNPVKTLVLKDPLETESFFETLQQEIKRGKHLAGFLCYELGYVFEKRLWVSLSEFCKNLDLPLAYFGVFEGMVKREEFRVPFESLTDEIFKELTFNLFKEEYVDAVHRIKGYIEAGDVYQVNYTFKTKFKFKGCPRVLFEKLLFSQRCEYAFYLETDDFVILSLSPELFLEKRKSQILSAPMKGTAKRGGAIYEDLEIKRWLRKDPKTQAENLMIVDLIRNDLGRVCEEGSVIVDKLFKIKTYPTLHQLISTVKGRLKEGKSLFEIFKALFPCGSVTGAPKIRAMEIISELEKEPRKVYTGAIGYINPRGDFWFNIAIRTLVFKRTEEGFKGEAGIGSGIVWDSDPEKEYDECLLKASFFTSPINYFELIETFLYEPLGESYLLELHYKRLIRSAKYFGFKIPEILSSPKTLKTYIELEFKKAGLSLRLKYKGRLLLSPSGKARVQFLPFEPWTQSLRVMLMKRDFNLGVFHFHKTTCRKKLDEKLRKARDMGFDEVIFFDEEGRLLEGAISNVFLKINGKLYTPPLRLGIVDGVFRKFLVLKGKAIPKILTLRDLERAEEIYLGNAVRSLGKVTDWFILK